MFSVSLPEFPSEPLFCSPIVFSSCSSSIYPFFLISATKSVICALVTLYTNFHNPSPLPSLFSFAQTRFLFSLFKNAVIIPLNSSLPLLCQGAVSPSKFAQQSCGCTSALISTDSPAVLLPCPDSSDCFAALSSSLEGHPTCQSLAHTDGAALPLYIQTHSIFP